MNQKQVGAGAGQGEQGDRVKRGNGELAKGSGRTGGRGLGQVEPFLLHFTSYILRQGIVISPVRTPPPPPPRRS
jgi:hypothetical protein